MATKTIPWITGSGAITLTYMGQGNGSVSVSSDKNEDIYDREQTIRVLTTNGTPDVVKSITIKQAGAPYDSLTENSLDLGDYIKVYTSTGLTRGYFWVPLIGYDSYNISVTVKSGSPIKAAIQLRNSTSTHSTNSLYDSGWITSGNTKTASNNTVSGASICAIVFTYANNNTGVPSVSEIQSYITLSIKCYVNSGETVTKTDTKTQNSITTSNYNSISTTTGLTRGRYQIALSKYYSYSISVSVASSSPIKVGIQLRTIAGSISNADKIYDSGWIAAGMNGSATKSNGGDSVECALVFTYINGSTGIPSLSEVKQYVSISFTGYYYASETTSSLVKTVTQSNLNAGNYLEAYTMSNLTRGNFAIRVLNYNSYRLTLSVKADSPIKGAIQLRTVYGSMSSADLLYDSGWITAGGSGAINQETASNAVECLLVFTYSSNNTGCPTINEISSYIDFEFIGIL